MEFMFICFGVLACAVAFSVLAHTFTNLVKDVAGAFAPATRLRRKTDRQSLPAAPITHGQVLESGLDKFMQFKPVTMSNRRSIPVQGTKAKGQRDAKEDE